MTKKSCHYKIYNVFALQYSFMYNDMHNSWNYKENYEESLKVAFVIIIFF